MMKINHLSVIYPDKTIAVDQIDLLIPSEENIALIGANGAGKTSLLLSLVGVVPSEGEIIVDEIRLDKHNLGEIRRRVGVVFQNPDNQLFMPTIFDDVAFGLRNYGVPENQIEEKVDYYLNALGILHLKHRSPLKLSGGEKRIAAIATILAMEPSIMLFDEPTAFLDPKARRNLIVLLNQLPHTKLIASHDLSFVAEVCDRAIVLKNGKIAADGKPSDLIYNQKLMDDCGIEAIPYPMKEKI
ncbi:MAG: ABC transporter ATP-binding protein [Erysipelotrichales bacterium]|nr:MAG: ABC transporter ATP-binding protein [Erysipelotrichales bacterium]